MASIVSSHLAFQVRCSVHEGRPDNFQNMKTPFSLAVKTLVRALPQVPDMIRIELSKSIKNTYGNVLDAFVDSVFEFVDLPFLPSQKNFAPVEELGGPVVISSIEGNIPDNFPEGVYVRNGSNPLFGGLNSTKSVFGKSFQIWVEGEGMLHALYFGKNSYNNNNDSNWTVCYNNRYVETETFKLEKQRNKPSFLPTVGGDSSAIVSAYLLNLMRFGKVNKYSSNTNVFEHAGKLYSITEDHMPQEINISTLETLGNWTPWNRPFTSHPKRAPDTGELVIIGMNPMKPFAEIGVISADGKKLVHRADFKLDRCTYCHDFGITQRYNVFMDFPLTIDVKRLFLGGPLFKFSKESYARIGVMPRYGDPDSIQWFQVQLNCTIHLFNCFEDGDDEVVVWGCRALDSVIPGPYDPNSKANFDAKIGNGVLYDRPYEWRLNMRTGEVRERNLTVDTEMSMDFPMINGNLTGLKNKFGYTQVLDVMATSTANHLPKYGGLAKLHFEELETRISSEGKKLEEGIKVEYHMFEKNTFCTGAAFVPNNKGGLLHEDDGWIVTFVHNEDTNTSQAFVIDAKKFSDKPVAKISLPCRVPYGFHGTFIPMS